MVLLEALATVGLGARDLFMYNRKGFMFNILLGQEAAYRMQDNKLILTLLYREDAFDLFGLSLKRMRYYALVSTVLLLITMGFLAHGELPETTPSWLFYMWAVSGVSCMLFLFVATWFSVLASVSAQILLTRMRTQWVRMPLASTDQVNDPAVPVKEFEKSSKTMRVPVISDQITTQPVTRASSISDLAEFTDHFVLYQELITNFQGYESFGRIALVFGVHQLANAMTYTALILSPLSSTAGSLAYVGFGLCVNFANLKTNLLISDFWFSLFYAVVATGPLVASIASAFSLDDVLAPVTMAGELLSLAALTGFAMKMERGLPLLFSSVIQLDLLGLIKNNSTAEVAASCAIPTAPVVSRSLLKASDHIKAGESILAQEDGDLVKQHLSHDQKQHRYLTDDVYLVDDDGSQADSFFFICYVCLFLWLAGLLVSVVHAASKEQVILGWVNTISEKIN
jgi:hypothetical protein